MINRKYDPKKERRDWYFVEYHPPSGGKFANLYLTVLGGDVLKKDIITAMEMEAVIWLKLYPIPLMVFSFDNKGRLYKFDRLKANDGLVVFF